jgi:hypothetical protein
MPTDLTALSGGKELDTNHANHISFEQIHLFLMIFGTIFKSVVKCVG